MDDNQDIATGCYVRKQELSTEPAEMEPQGMVGGRIRQSKKQKGAAAGALGN
jgi:hypothetical protein